MDQRLPDTLTLAVGAATELSGRRAEIADWLRRHTVDGVADDVLLACGEAIDNALEHGIPPVTVQLAWDGIGELTVVVRDSGKWRVSAPVQSRGLGLPIMTALMDNVSIDTTDGTAIQLTRRLSVRREGE